MFPILLRNTFRTVGLLWMSDAKLLEGVLSCEATEVHVSLDWPSFDFVVVFTIIIQRRFKAFERFPLRRGQQIALH